MVMDVVTKSDGICAEDGRTETNHNHNKYPSDDNPALGFLLAYDDVKLSLKRNRQFVMRIKQTPAAAAAAAVS